MMFLYLEGAGDPYPALSAEELEQFNVEVPPEANTVFLQGGFESSRVCLLLPSGVADSIARDKATHKVRLVDSVNHTTVDISGLVFDRAFHLDATADRDYGNPAVVVYLADKRLWFQKSLPPQLAFNLVSPYVTEPAADAYDANVAASFPYDPTSLDSTDPWEWGTLLTALWNSLPAHGTFPTLGTHVSYPLVNPIDIRPENRSAWQTFVDIVHSIGWEIYPTLAGGFYLAAIDDFYGQTSELPALSRLTDVKFPETEDKRLPKIIQVAFQTRNLSGSLKNWQPYYFIPITVSSVVPGGLTPTYSTDTNEILTSFVMTAVFRSDAELADNPQNLDDLQYYASYLVTRLIKERLGSNLFHEFSGLYNLAPKPEFPRISFYADDTSTLFSADSFDPNPSEMAHVDNSGGAGASVDITYVLIDKDIYIDPDDISDPVVPRGIIEDDPATYYTEDNTVLTDTEFDTGVGVFFQDPIPDDGNFDDNIVDQLPAWSNERIVVSLKKLHTPTKTVLNAGIVQDGTSDTITLAVGSSTVDAYYIGAKVTVTHVGDEDNPQEGTITVHDGGLLKITVTPAWPDATPDNSGDYSYSIWRAQPGWDPDPTKIKLAAQVEFVTDDSDPENVRKIGRYVYVDVFYDDGASFIREEYTHEDFPDLDESITLESLDLPEGFLKKRYRGYVLNGVLIVRLCTPLPPPSLADYL